MLSRIKLSVRTVEKVSASLTKINRGSVLIASDFHVSLHVAQPNGTERRKADCESFEASSRDECEYNGGLQYSRDSVLEARHTRKSLALTSRNIQESHNSTGISILLESFHSARER